MRITKIQKLEIDILDVYEDIDFILTELFLPFVKSEIQLEDPTILIP
jgi:hypothetical protein